MPTRPSLVLALSAALLLAGCGGVTTGGGSSTPQASPTVSPAPVPGAVTERPVAAARLDALPSEHVRALAGRSFTVTERLTVTGDTGTLYDVERVLEVDSAHERFSYHRRRVADPSYPGPQGLDSLSMYRTGDRVVFRFDDDGSVRYGVLSAPSPFGPGSDLDGGAALRGVTDAFGNWTATRPGDGTLRLRGEDLDDTTALPTERALGGPERGAAELRVRPGGLVERVAVEYTTRLNGRPVVVRSTRRFTAVGETSVERPDWYATALAAALPDTASPTRTPTQTPGTDPEGAGS
jgi:hypothetical protein